MKNPFLSPTLMKYPPLIMLFASVFLAASGVAQQSMISVRPMALQAGEMPEIHLMGENGRQPVTFSAAQPGEPILARTATPLPLYESRTDPEGNREWVVSQRVRIPAGAREILLLGWPSGDGARYIAIADDFSQARFNDWLLINASSRSVAFAAGEEARPVVVRPGNSDTHRFNLRENEGVAVRAYTPVNDEPTVFYSTYWPVRQDRRSVILFADDGERILVRRIADRLAKSR